MGDNALSVADSGGQSTTVPVDAVRLRRVVDQHYDFIWRSLRRFGVTEAHAEDAAQEVLLVMSRKLDQVAVERERAYLFGVAIRVASGYRRTARRHPDSAGAKEQGDFVTSLPSPDELLDRSKARAVLDRIIEGLPDDLRAVFVLFEIEEMTMVQIAELLELPMGTVASRLRRSREQFEAAVSRYQARAGRGSV